MYKLVIADDEGKTTVVPLVRDEITIGRKEGNTIRLTERNISRKHAKLRKLNGSYVVEDLSSYNGVKVNGRRIGGEIALKPGDQIAIGDYQLALQLEESATIPETTAPMTMPGGYQANGGGEAATTMLRAPAVQAAPTIPIASTPPATGAAPSISTPARLVMTSPPAPGAEFALSRPLTRIGRAEELDIWVNHRSISREHAEVANDQGTLRIRDLGSANGVRLNGREIQQADLKPGDVVELGQVRFRYVAPGESFVFEAERTMQLDAVIAEKSPSRAPMLIAAGIVGIAVIGAVAVAMSGEPDTEVLALPPAPVADSVAPVAPSVSVAPVAPSVEMPAAPAPVPTLAQQASEASAACRAAISSGDHAAAIGHADRALAIQPGDPLATACRQEADLARADEQAWLAGEAARAAGDVEGACAAYLQLSPSSTLRARPEVSQACRDVLAARLTQASELLSTDPARAEVVAQSVLDTPGIDDGTRRSAELALSRARVRIAQAGPPAARVGPRPDPRGGGQGGRPGGARPDPGGARFDPQTASPRPDSRGGAQASAGGGGAAAHSEGQGATGGLGGGGGDSGASPMAAAQACLVRNDNPCVIRALEGRARTPQEMRLLIETYRAVGNTPRMHDTMRRFVERFPSDPRAGQYRQILNLQR